VWSWTGLYIGANAGWIGSSSNTITNTGTDTGTGGLGTFLGAGKIAPALARTCDAKIAWASAAVAEQPQQHHPSLSVGRVPAQEAYAHAGFCDHAGREAAEVH
jgi:hypothetical protein